MMLPTRIASLRLYVRRLPVERSLVRASKRFLSPPWRPYCWHPFGRQTGASLKQAVSLGTSVVCLVGVRAVSNLLCKCSSSPLGLPRSRCKGRGGLAQWLRPAFSKACCRSSFAWISESLGTASKLRGLTDLTLRSPGKPASWQARRCFCKAVAVLHKPITFPRNMRPQTADCVA